jgi:bacterioferritin-associated ferredoxin
VIVCHCHAVSDRVVREAVQAGAADVDDVGDVCGAGTDCGGCLNRLAMVVASENPVELARAS